MIILITIAVSIFWLWILKKFESPGKLKDSRSVLGYLFLCGLSSVPVAFILYELGDNFYAHIAYLSLFTYNILFVGLFEEISKFIVFYSIAKLSDFIREPKDGLLQAAAVALGFAITENVLYAASYGLGNLMLRSVLGTLGHMSYAAIWGYATGLYLYSRRAGKNEYSYSMVAGAVGVAAVFHGFYNYFLDFDLVAVAFLVKAADLSIVIYILRYLKTRSPYRFISYNKTNAALAEITAALGSNPDSFILNKRAGFHCIRSGKYTEAVKYLKKAASINKKELSARVFIILLEYHLKLIEEYQAFRSLDKLCSRISTSDLIRLKNQTAELFKNIPDQSQLVSMLDDIIESGKDADASKRRIDEFSGAAAVLSTGISQSGFLISDKDSLPLAFRHPGYYKDANAGAKPQVPL